MTLILPIWPAVEAGLAGQRAQHVAGTDLVLAAADHLQRHHRGAQHAAGCRHQFGERVPVALGTLQLFDLADVAHLVEARQAERQALGIDAAGAADAVDVHRRVGRDVDVDHRFELRDVQTARGHVGRDQHRAAAVDELHQHLIAVALLQLAVQRQCREALGLQHLDQIAALLTRVAERQRADRAEVQQQAADRMQALVVAHLVAALLDLARGMLRRHLDLGAAHA